MSTYRSAVYEWLPPDVELMTDTSEADWVVSALRPWDEKGVRVGSFMPDVFEVYAGYRTHVIRSMVGPAAARSARLLFSGSMDRGDVCWFCLWDGWGTCVEGCTRPPDVPRRRRRSRAEREEVRDAAREERRIDDDGTGCSGGPPAFERRIATTSSSEGRSPRPFRWPRRRATRHRTCGGPRIASWLVSSEIDGEVTCVGGSKELIGSLLASRRLEALETSVSARLG